MPTEPGLKILPGMMPILHSPAVITPGQFGPISRDFEPHSARLTLHHVEHRNAFGDADDQRNLGLDRFADRVGGAGRRHVNHAGIAAGLARALRRRCRTPADRDGSRRLCRATAADHLGAVGDRLLGMERAVLAGKALADDLGVLVDEDGHYAASFTALTIFCAASSRSSAEIH